MMPSHTLSTPSARLSHLLMLSTLSRDKVAPSTVSVVRCSMLGLAFLFLHESLGYGLMMTMGTGFAFRCSTVSYKGYGVFSLD